MPSVPLSTFIEFTVSQGTARVNAATLPSGDYDPRKDFYKRLRERTVRQLVEGWSEQEFRRSIRGLASPRKRASFEACRAGLSSWAQGKEISGRRARSVTWAAAGLEVRVNPELRLGVDGRQFAAKLYFKVPELSAERRDNILCLPRDRISGPAPHQPQRPTAAAARVGRSEGMPRCQGVHRVQCDGAKDARGHLQGAGCED